MNNRRLPRSYWITLGVVVVGGYLAYLGISEQARKEADARQVGIERSTVRYIDHVCEPWKADSAQFNECGEVYRVYEKCEAARLHMLEHEGDMSSAGVVCEHPKYQFHARQQKEMDDARQNARGPAG
jgi:hypothetical protein